MISAMQQTQRDRNLERAMAFRDIVFQDHEPDCECEPEPVPQPTVIHGRKCKASSSHCTCKPVFVHAPVVEN